MTRGYLHGHFSFKYPQPLSRIRESYLLGFLAKETTGELFRTRALLDSSFIGLNTKENMVEKMFDSYKTYAQIALPSRTIPDKIEDISKDTLKELRSKLKSMKPALKPSNIK